jgi:GNAT superfamily N-acetyltransferase
METVRPARKTDHSLLPIIEQSADALFEELGITNLPPAADESELEQAMTILVIGDPIKGFARIEEVDGNAHLEQLSVGREYSGQGFGTKLLEASCIWAKSSGYARISLITFRDIPWNAPFYSKHQFFEQVKLSAGLTSLRDHEKKLGLDVIGDRIVMSRELI